MSNPPPTPPWPALALSGLQVLLLDEPVAHPVRTSFGVMHSRPGLLVRLMDDTGAHGTGEVWCNFPPGGARYKATLATRVVAPLLRARVLGAPHELLPALQSQLSVLALQCGDAGALAQVLAGIDQAAWDLFARRLGAPLWRLRGGRSRVPVYASGIGPQRVAETITEHARAGHVRFKIKLGFGDAADADHLALARRALPSGGVLLADVNQGWTEAQALRWLPRLADAGVQWCEEPLRADAPWAQWQRLAAAAPAVRLAGGENLMGAERFVAAADDGGLRVLQPDLGKWGGFSANFDLAARLQRPDVWICPHWLAGGVGLAASLQYKAAIGGAGWVEVDANPNPLRSGAFERPLAVEDGAITLGDDPGIAPPLAPAYGRAAAWTADAGA